MTKAKLGAGNVEIEIGGNTFVLKPNLKAAQTISRQTGGIRAALTAVSSFDLDTITTVIALGLNWDSKAAAALPEMVYETGVGSLVAPVTKYLVILANGGRPVGDDEGGEGDENPPK